MQQSKQCMLCTHKWHDEKYVPHRIKQTTSMLNDEPRCTVFMQRYLNPVTLGHGTCSHMHDSYMTQHKHVTHQQSLMTHCMHTMHHRYLMTHQLTPWADEQQHNPLPQTTNTPRRYHHPLMVLLLPPLPRGGESAPVSHTGSLTCCGSALI